MSYRRSGINPLSYMGVEPLDLAADVAYPRPPTQNDINFNLSTRWLDTEEDEVWILVNLEDGIAKWILFASGTGNISKVTTDDALVVVPDANGNINVFGDHGINTTGSANPFPNTATVLINNTITLGDLADVGAGASLTLQTGVLEIVNGDAIIGNTDVSALASTVQFEKSRSGGVITSGDELGSVAFQGYDGTAYKTGASIVSESVGTVAANRIGAELQFFTHPDSTNPLAERMTIGSAGTVTINDADGAADSLVVSGTSEFVQNVVIDVPSAGDSLTVAGTSSFLEDATFSADVELLSGNILMPNTNTAATEGIIEFGAAPFVSNYGTNNTFIGKNSGNTSLTTVSATNNTGIGNQALVNLTTGTLNTVLGSFSGSSLTTGSDNTGIGYDALTHVTTGSFNVALGQNAGNTLGATDSSNILIGHPGVAADNHTTRIGGATGAGSGQQNKAYMSGVNGVTLTPGFKVVTIDPATDQLGVTSATGAGTIVTTFTASGTWTINPATVWVEIFGWGGGGGGAAGNSSAGTPNGGGGGACGTFFFHGSQATFFNPAGETVTIGGGATGASGTSGTTGANGGTPTASSLGLIKSSIGGAATGGTTGGGGTGGTFGLSQIYGIYFQPSSASTGGGNGASSNGLPTSQPAANSGYGMSAGSGGGGGVGGTVGLGGSVYNTNLGGSVLVQGGITTGQVGANGINTANNFICGGAGGAGSSVSGNGGNGGVPGGGGGGGRGVTAGTSGGGGNGGRGQIYVVEYL